MATSIVLLNCCEIVRATNLRITSPVTMPRTPPSALRSAVMRPIRIIETIVSGTSARANLSASLKKRPWHLRLSSSTRKCSVVMPLGPAAAPLFAILKIFKKIFSLSSKGTYGTWLETSAGNGSRISGGLLEWSDKHLQRFIRPWCQIRTLQRLRQQQEQFPSSGNPCLVPTL